MPAFNLKLVLPKFGGAFKADQTLNKSEHQKRQQFSVHKRPERLQSPLFFIFGCHQFTCV